MLLESHGTEWDFWDDMIIYHDKLSDLKGFDGIQRPKPMISDVCFLLKNDLTMRVRDE